MSDTPKLTASERVRIIETTIRTIPDFPKPGILFRDITPVLADPKIFKASIELFSERYLSQHIDKVVAIESRGFIFGSALALSLGCGLAIVRKPGKLPGTTIKESYSLEYGTDSLEIHADAIAKGERSLIIDDLLATGGTANAACKLVARLGGKIVECSFVIELLALEGRKHLSCPVFSVLSF
jgi:adenine phosphoribosyltransferase